MKEPSPPAIELFDLPEALRALLAKAGYDARLAVVARADGRPVGDYDRRLIPALLAAAAEEGGGPRAREAFAVARDGGVTWRDGEAPSATKARHKAPREAAATGTRKAPKARKAARSPSSAT